MKKKKIDNPDYLTIFEKAFEGEKYKEINRYLGKADSTFSEKITTLEQGLHLITTKGYNNKIIKINYTGCSIFLFENFFKEDMKKYRNAKLWKINHSSEKMKEILKEYFETNLSKSNTIRELFENLVLFIGSYTKDLFTKQDEFLRQYELSKKQNIVDTLKKLYDSEEFDLKMEIIRLYNEDKNKQIKHIQNILKQTKKIKNVESEKVLGIFSFSYYCKHNNIDLFSFLFNSQKKFHITMSRIKT